MSSHRVWSALPYAVLLALAAWFYNMAGSIAFDHQGDNLGPDFWPRLLLALIMAIAAVQGSRILLFGRPAEAPALIGTEEEDEAPRSNMLLSIGVGLTIAYGAAVTILGFLITTFLFLVAFMYAGRYRAHLAVWLSSAAGAVLLTLLFQKVVYVSLPRGIVPFSHVADALLALF
jgi:putative tricarboxylic transport membrane protein